MRQYECLIKEFRDITPRNGSGITKKYRMTIEAILKQKIDQPNEKQHWKTYQINVFCNEILRNSWWLQELSDNDLGKFLYEYSRRHFIGEFKKGNMSESKVLDLPLSTQNVPDKCPFDLSKIQCEPNFRFPIEVPIKIGFR